MKVKLAKILNMMGHSRSSSIVALVKDSEYPFAEHIQTSHVPKWFKLLSLESYNGSTDPVDHW